MGGVVDGEEEDCEGREGEGMREGNGRGGRWRWKMANVRVWELVEVRDAAIKRLMVNDVNRLFLLGGGNLLCIEGKNKNH